ncbi:hypothetical protein HPB52_000011 [Rhipicephalus sanguineus]|uniref:C3H1-type domain-containing protein n=1 Tax=Rhipicephalus sanguineus TaxID=34632 RepID=A0A9D4QHB2_RHISA|nr:hypothetical protein HPB52_000011 [Rhipicephalus sanguineus]
MNCKLTNGGPVFNEELTEDISEDAVEAAPAVPVAKKCLNSRSMEPLEGELDFEDDAPPESPSGTSLDKAPNKDSKEGKAKADNLEEGEAEDDGEVSDTELSVQDDDLEEGELPEGAGGGTGATRKAAQAPRPICRFFNKGQCTWGSSCRFIHPGINDRGNYNMFATVPKPPHHHMPPPIGGPAAVMRGGAPPPEFLGPPMPPLPPPPEEMMLPPVESAWERGLRHAKELMKRASRRKEQEPDFEEKRLNIVPPHHDRTPLQSEVDKENDFYGASVPPTSRGMSPPYVRPPMPPPPPHHLPRGGRRGDSRRDDFYGIEGKRTGGLVVVMIEKSHQGHPTVAPAALLLEALTPVMTACLILLDDAAVPGPGHLLLLLHQLEGHVAISPHQGDHPCMALQAKGRASRVVVVLAVEPVVAQVVQDLLYWIAENSTIPHLLLTLLP